MGTYAPGEELVLSAGAMRRKGVESLIKTLKIYISSLEKEVDCVFFPPLEGKQKGKCRGRIIDWSPIGGQTVDVEQRKQPWTPLPSSFGNALLFYFLFI